MPGLFLDAPTPSPCVLRRRYMVVIFVRSATASKTEAFTPRQMSTCSLTRTSHDMRKAEAVLRARSLLLARDGYLSGGTVWAGAPCEWRPGASMDQWKNADNVGSRYLGLSRSRLLYDAVGQSAHVASLLIQTRAHADSFGGHMGQCAALIRQLSFTSSESTRPISR